MYFLLLYSWVLFCSASFDFEDYISTYYATDEIEMNPSRDTESTRVPNPQITPLSSDAFLVVWATSFNDQNSDIFGTIFSISDSDYNDDGTSDGVNEQTKNYTFRINNFTSNSQDSATATALYDMNNNMLNRFVVCWESSYQDGSYDGVFCNIFEHFEEYEPAVTIFRRNDGNDISEFQINEKTIYPQRSAKVTSLFNSNSFVVSWLSYNFSTFYDVYARIYDNNGKAKTGEFLVHESTTFQEYAINLSPIAVTFDIECNNIYTKNCEKNLMLNENNTCLSSHNDNNSSYFVITWTASDMVFVNIVNNNGQSCLSQNEQLIGNSTQLRNALNESDLSGMNRWQYSDVTYLWENYFAIVWQSDKRTDYYDQNIQCAIYHYNISSNSLELKLLIPRINKLIHSSGRLYESTRAVVSIIDLQGCSMCESQSNNDSNSDSSFWSSSEDDDNEEKTAILQVCWQTFITSTSKDSDDSEYDISCEWIYLEYNLADSLFEYTLMHGENNDFVISEYTQTNTEDDDDDNEPDSIYPTLATFYRAIVSNGDSLSLRTYISEEYLPQFYSIVGWQTVHTNDDGYGVYGRVISIDVEIEGNHHVRKRSETAMIAAFIFVMICIICTITVAYRLHKNRVTISFNENNRNAGHATKGGALPEDSRSESHASDIELGNETVKHAYGNGVPTQEINNDQNGDDDYTGGNNLAQDDDSDASLGQTPEKINVDVIETR